MDSSKHYIYSYSILNKAQQTAQFMTCVVYLLIYYFLSLLYGSTAYSFYNKNKIQMWIILYLSVLLYVITMWKSV
jgi:hypothetical protein